MPYGFDGSDSDSDSLALTNETFEGLINEYYVSDTTSPDASVSVAPLNETLTEQIQETTEPENYTAELANPNIYSIIDFPPEIITNILSFLPKSDLMQASLATKYFYRVATVFYFKPYIENFLVKNHLETEEKLVRLAKKARGSNGNTTLEKLITAVEVDMVWEKVKPTIIGECKKIDVNLFSLPFDYISADILQTFHKTGNLPVELQRYLSTKRNHPNFPNPHPAINMINEDHNVIVFDFPINKPIKAKLSKEYFLQVKYLVLPQDPENVFLLSANAQFINKFGQIDNEVLLMKEAMRSYFGELKEYLRKHKILFCSETELFMSEICTPTINITSDEIAEIRQRIHHNDGVYKNLLTQAIACVVNAQNDEFEQLLMDDRLREYQPAFEHALSVITRFAFATNNGKALQIIFKYKKESNIKNEVSTSMGFVNDYVNLIKLIIDLIIDNPQDLEKYLNDLLAYAANNNHLDSLKFLLYNYSDQLNVNTLVNNGIVKSDESSNVVREPIIYRLLSNASLHLATVAIEKTIKGLTFVLSLNPNLLFEVNEDSCADHIDKIMNKILTEKKISRKKDRDALFETLDQIRKLFTTQTELHKKGIAIQPNPAPVFTDKSLRNDFIETLFPSIEKTSEKLAERDTKKRSRRSFEKSAHPIQDKEKQPKGKQPKKPRSMTETLAIIGTFSPATSTSSSSTSKSSVVRRPGKS